MSSSWTRHPSPDKERSSSRVMFSYMGVAVLTLVFALNMGNRFLLSMITEPVRLEFGLSDGQVGILVGAISALFIVVAGIPFGVLTDRANRRWLIFICCFLFSAMTALGGYAQNFLSLAFSRIGVGIGAGGTTPPSISILSDSFPVEKRGVVMTLFTLGVCIGAILGTTVVGWVSDQYGWRIAMTAFGLAGIPLSALVLLIVREPKRGAFDDTDARRDPIPIVQTLVFIWRRRALFHILAGSTVVTMWTWGIILWLPAILGRKFAMSPGEVGVLLGPVHLIGGIGSIFITAFIMRILARRSLAAQTLFICLCAAVGTIPSMIALYTSSQLLSLTMLWIYIPIGYLYTGPVFSLVSDLSLPGMRGQTASLITLTSTLGDLVIMPPLLGYLSDGIAPLLRNSAQSLPISALVFSLTGFWGAYHFYAATRHLRREAIADGAEASGTANAAQR